MAGPSTATTVAKPLGRRSRSHGAQDSLVNSHHARRRLLPEVLHDSVERLPAVLRDVILLLLPSDRLELGDLDSLVAPLLGRALRQVLAEHLVVAVAVGAEVAQVAGAAAPVVVEAALVLAAVQRAATALAPRAAVGVEAGVDKIELLVVAVD